MPDFSEIARFVTKFRKDTGEGSFGAFSTADIASGALTVAQRRQKPAPPTNATMDPSRMWPISATKALDELIAKFNPNHVESGSDGGQFTSADSAGAAPAIPSSLRNASVLTVHDTEGAGDVRVPRSDFSTKDFPSYFKDSAKGDDTGNEVRMNAKGIITEPVTLYHGTTLEGATGIMRSGAQVSAFFAGGTFGESLRFPWASVSREGGDGHTGPGVVLAIRVPAGYAYGWGKGPEGEDGMELNKPLPASAFSIVAVTQKLEPDASKNDVYRIKLASSGLAKAFDEMDELVTKFNVNHDELGRFSFADGESQRRQDVLKEATHLQTYIQAEKIPIRNMIVGIKNTLDQGAKIAEATNGQPGGVFETKTLGGLQQKMLKMAKDEPNLTAKEVRANIGDALRYTLIFNPRTYTQQTDAAIKMMKDAGYTVKGGDRGIKNAWLDDNAYRGINTNFISPKGVTFELQFHTPASWDTKQNITHTLYQEARAANTSDARQIELDKETRAAFNRVPYPDVSPGHIGYPTRYGKGGHD